MISATANGREAQLTAEALVDLETPDNVRLSPSGRQVVYSLSTPTRKGEHAVSSLWIAQVGKEHSARQLTAGLSKDDLPQWSPDGQHVAFLSDRAKPGESSAIYLLSLEGGEAVPISKTDNKKDIDSFSWSPNGRFIAFVSPDEKTAEREAREKEKDDANVYGENWEFNRLRCLHVPTRELTTLFAKDSHVAEFAWNEDSTEIAYSLHETPDLNSPGYKGLRFERVSLTSKKTSPICDFPGLIYKLVWSGTELFFLAGAVPNRSNSSLTVYKTSLARGTWSRHAYGIESCASDLSSAGTSVAVKVQSGLSDQIHLLDGPVLHDEKYELSTWDVVVHDKKPVVAFSKSSASLPPEIFSCEEGSALCQLSQHGTAIAKLQVGDAQPYYCTARDGTRLDGVFITPSRQREQTTPWRTVVLVHGGPYGRTTVSFGSLPFRWAPWLVAAGFAVLCPNYRGNSSRGEKFASGARGGMGTDDYDDIISMVKAGVSDGLIDEQRVAIGGWSQGGFLSYLAVTRQAFHFKAAICGAGVTDWDMMSMTSDAPFWEAELAGGAPWELDASSTKARHGSAIWHMKNVSAPVLILHGEDDVRVPLSQAIAFHRGCLHHGVPCELVTYPREGHMSNGPERLHLIDMLRRVQRFCDLHLNT